MNLTIADLLTDIHRIAAACEKQAAALEKSQACICTIEKLLNPITGIEVDPQKKGRVPMAGKLKTAFKKGAKAAKKFRAGDQVGSFTITDDPNTPNGYKVMATNLAGDILDVSDVASIVVTADNGNASFSVQGPTTFTAQGLAQGDCTATITLTWTDGSVGPFSGDVLFHVQPGGPTGLIVTPA